MLVPILTVTPEQPSEPTRLPTSVQVAADSIIPILGGLIMLMGIILLWNLIRPKRGG